MNSFDDTDAFAQWFDDATNKAHRQEYRSDRPSAKTWQDVDTRLSGFTRDQPDQDWREASDRQEHREGNTAPTRERTHRGIPAWTAAGLVILLVISGLYLNTIGGDDGGNQNLAWAPATVASTPTVTGDYACNVQPLTTDETLATVKNPLRAYERFGDHYPNDDPNEMVEIPVLGSSNWMPSSDLLPANDPGIEGELSAFGEQFWGCIQSGTAAQVWAMMDPVTLQSMILTSFPVIRTEEMLRTYIDLWGPKTYINYRIGQDRGSVLPIIYPERTIAIPDSDDYPILVSAPNEAADMTSRYAIIPLVTTKEYDIVEYYDLCVTQQTDGRWTVVRMVEHQYQSINGKG